jgi:ubiquinone/menaquinone biosynthesis C-methylase UbiE
VIIPLGLLRTGSSGLYRYLWRSVLEFDGAQELRARLQAAGFSDVRVQTVPGWQQNIVHTFLGRRPGEPLPTVDSDAPTPPLGIGLS